jgi:hypothetical protein
MHVCMYACMHVCMYACMHVCMYMHVCMHACMHARPMHALPTRAFTAGPSLSPSGCTGSRLPGLTRQGGTHTLQRPKAGRATGTGTNQLEPCPSLCPARRVTQALATLYPFRFHSTYTRPPYPVRPSHPTTPPYSRCLCPFANPYITSPPNHSTICPQGQFLWDVGSSPVGV